LARIRPLLRALGRVTWRELRALNSVTSNNFFLFCFLLMLQPQSTAFLLAVVGLLLFFPLSADPMKKIPPDRLALLPLLRWELVVLRVLSVFLSPAVWLIVGIAVVGGVRFRVLSLELLVLLFVANGVAFWGEQFLDKAPRLSLLRHIPEFPGRTGGLIRKNIRELSYLLDPYAALVLAISGVVYRIVSKDPQPDALFGITMLVVLALSTSAQRLFALDWTHGITRYRLMPLRGWRILLAKDAAYLLIAVPLVAPLAGWAGLAAAFAALAVGHQPSVMEPVQQAKWRFVTGASITHSIVQTAVMFGAGTVTFRHSILALPVCIALWMISLVAFGWWYDRAR
jgi:hypothetical protein